MTRGRRLLLLLAGLLLAGLSALLWQCRFERAGPSLALRVGGDAPGWVILGPERFRTDPNTWTLLPPDGKSVACAEGALAGFEGQRHLHVAVDAMWDNVTRRDDRSWWTARVSLGGRQADGRYVWPQDGDLINALGDTDWHRVECVFELPPDIGEPRVFINNLAATGTLGVRRLAITPVRERQWIRTATAALLIGWLAWTAAMLDRKHGMPRQVSASLLLVAAGWFLVFPQPHYHARPFPGGFALGRELPMTADMAQPPQPDQTPAAGIESPPVVRVAKSFPPPEAGTSHHLVQLFRRIDHDWRFAHVAVFCGFGSALFALLGMRNSWLSAMVIAGLSEVVPNVLLHEFRADDAVDLAANFAGLGLAALLMRATARMRRSRKRRES